MKTNIKKTLYDAVKFEDDSKKAKKNYDGKKKRTATKTFTLMPNSV